MLSFFGQRKKNEKTLQNVDSGVEKYACLVIKRKLKLLKWQRDVVNSCGYKKFKQNLYKHACTDNKEALNSVRLPI